MHHLLLRRGFSGRFSQTGHEARAMRPICRELRRHWPSHGARPSKTFNYQSYVILRRCLLRQNDCVGRPGNSDRRCCALRSTTKVSTCRHIYPAIFDGLASSHDPCLSQIYLRVPHDLSALLDRSPRLAATSQDHKELASRVPGMAAFSSSSLEVHT